MLLDTESGSILYCCWAEAAERKMAVAREKRVKDFIMIKLSLSRVEEMLFVMCLLHMSTRLLSNRYRTGADIWHSTAGRRTYCFLLVTRRYRN